MLKSCKYCGRIHDISVVCEQKQAAEQKRRACQYKHDPKIDHFRKSKQWQAIAEHIKHRDRRLCLCCLANLPGTEQRFNSYRLSVHHIVPIKTDWNSRLDNDNLITVCDLHHEMCEKGEIDVEVQRELVRRSKEGSILDGLASQNIPPGINLEK